MRQTEKQWSVVGGQRLVSAAGERPRALNTSHQLLATARRGITLLELLVVMLIMLMVTAAAIPVIAPALKNREMREATRLVTSYLGAAKARAVQTGRPVGVVIERFEPSATNGGAFAYQMSQIEVPPPYSGDVVGARLEISNHTTPSTGAQNAFAARYPYLTAQWFKAAEPTAYTGMLNNKLLKIGDQIQLNGQGTQYIVLGPDANEDGVIDAISSGSPLEFAFAYNPPLKQAFAWLNTAPAPQPASYQVFRQPVRTSTPPLVLPEGLVFDLSVSGVGPLLFNSQSYAGTLPAAPGGPIVRYDPQIIFSPSGRVEWVTNPTSAQLARTTDLIYLLLGRREWMFDVANRGDLKDIVFQNLSPIAPAGSSNVVQPPAENFWITISPQSGQVQTAQVAPHLQDYDNLSGNTLNTHIDVIKLALWGVDPTGVVVRTGALSFARESQSLGGR